ncbi:hypothetical protein CLV47_10575 [Antricoccus suffuscus]|uniref:Tetratricopeptide repeat protein n=1 Tax=Antricoccus suffuscus TaxID=1629062 RepID=A0A2T1A1I6_9ACTN|nr:hypothetical protein [Antricoccus suffuscus]PRZ42453.1 hypothetical protein CLV47_10575 [Antricoccus suffuscus]
MDYRDAEEGSNVVYDEATVTALEDFYERIHTAGQLDDGIEAEETAERLYRDAVDLDYPQGMMTALILRYSSEFNREARVESLQTFMRAIQLWDSRAEEIEPGIRQVILHIYPVAIDAMIALPGIPAARIDAVLDHMVRAHQLEGAPMSTVALCRAQWAAETGDIAAALGHLEAFLVDPEGWTQALQLRLGLMIYEATSMHEAGLQFVDERVAGAELDDDDRIYVGGTRSALLVREGRAVEAEAIARGLLEDFTLDVLHEEVGVEYLVLALLEDRPAVQRLIDWCDPDPLDSPNPAVFHLQAACARFYLADPATAALGEKYRAEAMANAAKFDARNGTSYRSDQMRRYWLGEST